MTLKRKHTILKQFTRITYICGIIFVIVGMLLSLVSQPAYASGSPKGNPTGASLAFTSGCTGACEEITATVCNTGTVQMAAPVGWELYYSATNANQRVITDISGEVGRLDGGQCQTLTAQPGSGSGQYWFKVYQPEGHPGTGSLWSDACSLDSCQAPVVNPNLDPTEDPNGPPASDPTPTPDVSPTVDPTEDPQGPPAGDPTPTPDASPTVDPTEDPNGPPAGDPTPTPDISPTVDPTEDPQGPPAGDPTPTPEVTPTVDPTEEPHSPPASDPTSTPEVSPTPDPAPAGDDPHQDMQPLEFFYECTGRGLEWVILNLNTFEVQLNWQLDGSSATGQIDIQAGSGIKLFVSPASTQVLIFSWEGAEGQSGTATETNGVDYCNLEVPESELLPTLVPGEAAPASEDQPVSPTTISTPGPSNYAPSESGAAHLSLQLPPLDPPVVSGSNQDIQVLIPVTGADHQVPGTGNHLFVYLGLVFIGMALMTQAINKRFVGV
jgi:hypothetical protein